MVRYGFFKPYVLLEQQCAVPDKVLNSRGIYCCINCKDGCQVQEVEAPDREDFSRSNDTNNYNPVILFAAAS